MPIITFKNDIKEETGKSLSVTAVGTMMAMENDIKILIVSTTDKIDNISRCFFHKNNELKTIKKFSNKTKALDTEEDVISMARMLKSNKLDATNITNYVRTVFKDKLDVLGGIEEEKDIDMTLITDKTPAEEVLKMQEEQKRIEERRELAGEIIGLYPKMISEASKHYDYVLIDLDRNINEDVTKQIVDMSSVVVNTVVQKLEYIDEMAARVKVMTEEEKIKNVILLGKYDIDSKLNYKNISRYIGRKAHVVAIPYNTLYFDAAQEAEAPTLFLRLARGLLDSEEKNVVFLKEIRRACGIVMRKIEEMQITY